MAEAPRYFPNLFDLSGRCALVTGGASGLGRAMALGLADAGARVIIADLNLQGAQQVAGDIEGRGGRADATQVDVADRAGVAAMVRGALGSLGRIRILVNSAGIGGRGAAADYSEELWKKVLEVNLTGTFNCCREVGRHMIEQGGGSIINIASIAGFVGYAGSVGYQASKGGVVEITRTLAIEWARHNVRVNGIAPCVISTPLLQSQAEREPEFFVAFKERHPFKRFGTPDEVVGPAIFLASDAASLVTGHTLAVDGGYLAQ